MSESNLSIASEKYDAFNIPLSEILVDSKFNCRVSIQAESLGELQQSILKHGLEFPVVVQPISESDYNGEKPYKWKLLCGFRRFMVAEQLNWPTIPAMVREGLNIEQARMANVVENLDRQNLSPLEEALVIKNNSHPWDTDEVIAKKFNRNPHWVATRRKILTFPESIQKAIHSGRIAMRDIGKIAHASDPIKMAKKLIKAKENGQLERFRSGKRSKPSVQDVKALITQLLGEGFSPMLLRVFAWELGQVSEEELELSLEWLRSRKEHLQ